MSFNLDTFLPYQLSITAAQISQLFARKYEAEAGLTNPEWRVLAHLDREGEVSIRDINVRVNLDKSVVSRAASRLEGTGLVRKSSNDMDRRLIVLELTPEGQVLMQRLGRIAEDFQAELQAELGSEAGLFMDILARLTAHPQSDQ